ncbi:hypothetical protein KCV07_g3778, partial [Aureobasidium melanogenum]
MSTSLTPPDFGYDHGKHLNASQVAALLASDFGTILDAGTKKTVMLVELEKAYALRREAANCNNKDFLEDDFDPNQRSVTIPMLRQILSQYDISYAKYKVKSDLVKIFSKNLPRLRELNQPQRPSRSRNPFRQPQVMAINSLNNLIQPPQQRRASDSRASQSFHQDLLQFDLHPAARRRPPPQAAMTASVHVPASSPAATGPRQSHPGDWLPAATRPPSAPRMTYSLESPRRSASLNAGTNSGHSASHQGSTTTASGRGTNTGLASETSVPTGEINATSPLFMSRARLEARGYVSTLIIKDGNRALQLAANGMLEESINCLTKMVHQCSAFVDQCAETEFEEQLSGYSASEHVKREGSSSDNDDRGLGGITSGRADTQERRRQPERAGPRYRSSSLGILYPELTETSRVWNNL